VLLGVSSPLIEVLYGAIGHSQWYPRPGRLDKFGMAASPVGYLFHWVTGAKSRWAFRLILAHRVWIGSLPTDAVRVGYLHRLCSSRHLFSWSTLPRSPSLSHWHRTYGSWTGLSQ